MCVRVLSCSRNAHIWKPSGGRLRLLWRLYIYKDPDSGATSAALPRRLRDVFMYMHSVTWEYWRVMSFSTFYPHHAKYWAYRCMIKFSDLIHKNKGAQKWDNTVWCNTNTIWHQSQVNTAQYQQKRHFRPMYFCFDVVINIYQMRYMILL